MSFVGPAHRLGDAWVRPHDVEILHAPNGQTVEAMVDRIVHLGFEVRVELTLSDGDHFSVQLTRDQAEELELDEGQIVFVRPRAARVFGSEDGTSSGGRQVEVT
jgi:sulfate transport system ATP-binding protein